MARHRKSAPDVVADVLERVKNLEQVAAFLLEAKNLPKSGENDEEVTDLGGASPQAYYEDVCFLVKVDTFFLAYSGDWVEKPQLAYKFAKANKADQHARDLRKVVGEERDVRVVRCKTEFTVEELP